MPRPKAVGLVLVHLRLRERDVRLAKRRARQLAAPYQHIIRGWVTQGAAAAGDTDEAYYRFRPALKK